MYRTGVAGPGAEAVAALFRPGRIGPVAIGNRFVRAGTAEGMVGPGNRAGADLPRLLGELQLARHALFRVTGGFRGGTGSGQKPTVSRTEV